MAGQLAFCKIVMCHINKCKLLLLMYNVIELILMLLQQMPAMVLARNQVIAIDVMFQKGVNAKNFKI